ncbi:MAG: hypothetical protein F4X98_19240 [Gammaproteobacteria bacterium]|nr:hypothetical protein [Gammaproteobacteria bacterium]
MKTLTVACVAVLLCVGICAQAYGPPGNGESTPTSDRDGDTVPDGPVPMDRCPNEWGPADNEGCPRRVEEVIVTGRRIKNIWQDWTVTCPNGDVKTSWTDCSWYSGWTGTQEIRLVFHDTKTGYQYTRTLTEEEYAVERMADCIMAKVGDVIEDYDITPPLRRIGLSGDGQHVIHIADTLDPRCNEDARTRAEGCALLLSATVDGVTYTGYVTQLTPRGASTTNLWNTLTHEIAHHVSGDYGHEQWGDWFTARRDIRKLAKSCR